MAGGVGLGHEADSFDYGGGDGPTRLGSGKEGYCCNTSRDKDDSQTPNLDLVHGNSLGLGICALGTPTEEVQNTDTTKNERLALFPNLREKRVEMPFGPFWRGGVWHCIFGVYTECGLESFCLLPQQIKFLL